jgi:hypothetical protein
MFWPRAIPLQDPDLLKQDPGEPLALFPDRFVAWLPSVSMVIAAVPWRAQTKLVVGGGTEGLVGVLLLRFDADGLVVEEREQEGPAPRTSTVPGKLWFTLWPAGSPVWERRIRLHRRFSLLFDTGAPGERERRTWVHERLAVRSRADHQ